MIKFKKGDRVQCIKKHDSYMDIGDEATVREDTKGIF